MDARSASVFIAVGAMVIFQPELRRMLANWATCRFLPPPAKQREAIEVIIQICERLRMSKIGALIAIDSPSSCRRPSSRASRWIADATAEMLETFSSQTTRSRWLV